MLLTQIIQSISTLFSNYFIYFNKTYYSIILAVVSSILNIVLCILLVPDFGMIGAVLATFTVSLIVCMINFNFAHKHCLKI
jgi:O-antigen/teichoic acid export membrane protein